MNLYAREREERILKKNCGHVMHREMIRYVNYASNNSKALRLFENAYRFGVTKTVQLLIAVLLNVYRLKYTYTPHLHDGLLIH